VRILSFFCTENDSQDKNAVLGSIVLNLKGDPICARRPSTCVLLFFVVFFRVLLLTRHAFTLRDFHARNMTRTQFFLWRRTTHVKRLECILNGPSGE